MLLPSLITLFIIFGAIVYYIYILSPKLNPMNRAENFLKQNMVREAILEYKKILEKDPGNILIHYRLSNLYQKNNMIDQAVIHLEEIMKIDKYNYEVDKIEVLRRLAKSYLYRGEYEKAMQSYLNILNVYPADFESMYQVAFMFLGQEIFDQAYKYFEKLVEHNKKNFEVMYGTGMAGYMFQKAHEASDCFQQACILKPDSDIANISAAFAFQRRKDYKNAIFYAKKVIDSSSDQAAFLIAKRLLALLYLQFKKFDESYQTYREIIEYASGSDLKDELILTKYDLGFAFVKDNNYQKAYEILNDVYQMDKAYKNTQALTTLLRKQLSPEQAKADFYSDNLSDQFDKWVEEYFPENFLWEICGLKSDKKIDFKNIVFSLRIPSVEGKSPSSHVLSSDYFQNIEKFTALDTENFKIISNRVVSKLGYSVDQILATYKDTDGVDFMAKDVATGEKTLIWVRRWKGAVLGEIPLRNLAQAITDTRSKKGMFVSTSFLTSSAETALQNLSRIKVVSPEEVGELLSGLV
jgi:tetratricopeptide (TPR) repeat protein